MSELVADWKQWHRERNEELREPHGWLSLTNLEWVDSNPAPLESFPGVWSADAHAVTVTFTEADEVNQDGVPVVGAITLEIPVGESDRSLETAAGVQAEVASRFGRIVVRTRDPKAKRRAEFTETDTYSFDDEWIITADWVPYAQAVSVPVPSAHEALPMTLTGRGEMEVLGQTVTVTGSDPESLQLIFHDQTNGSETEAWRAAPVTIQGGQATVDFNRSVNFPAHFTPFGTCPTPPEGNTFEFAVTAGEKKNS